jgi:hypothetical protein
MFDHFLNFNGLVEDGAPRRRGDRMISPPFTGFLGFMVYVMGMGCRTMGLTHA